MRSPSAEPPPERPRPWQRLHAALMPDYNRASTTYWWTMLLLGCAAWLHGAWQLAALPWATLTLIGGGVTVAMLMAMFPLRIPRTNQSFSIGDVFIFLLLLMHGPAAGCVAAGLESLVSAWRSSRRWTTRLGSASIASLAMAITGNLLQWLVLNPSTATPGHAAPDPAHSPVLLVLAAMVFGLLHAACSVPLMAVVARLKRNQRLHVTDFVSVFGWVGGASAGAAALAALLFITERLAGLGVMLTILPIIALLLTTMHFFARQQQADQAIRKATEQALKHEAELAASRALQREAELAAQHLRDLESSEKRFHSAFTHASIGMVLVEFDGRVLQAGPSANMHWIDPTGAGLVRTAGMRGDDVYSQSGNAVMYDIGKILKVGGSTAYSGAASTRGAGLPGRVAMSHSVTARRSDRHDALSHPSASLQSVAPSLRFPACSSSSPRCARPRSRARAASASRSPAAARRAACTSWARCARWTRCSKAST